MTPLEERYRRLVGWLPEPARSRWSEDMVATYLEVATADDPEFAEYGSPSTADRWDVARLAVRLHLGAPGASVRAVAAGRAVRLVAVVGAVWLAVQGVVGAALTAWVHDLVPFVAAPDTLGPLGWGPQEAFTVVLDGLFVALAVCLVRGLAAARLLALAVVAVQYGLLAGWLYSPAGLEWLSLLPLLVVLGAAALVPPEPLRPRPWWLLVVPALTLATLWPARLPGEVNGWLVALADPVVHGAFGLTGALVVLAVRNRAARGPAELAVAVLSTLLVAALLDQWSYDVAAGYRPVVVAATAAAALTALVAAAIGLRAVRALPVTVPAES